MLQFQPKTRDQILQEERERNESMLLPKGEYDFEVMSAEDAISSKKNPMIKLKLKVWGPDGKEHHIYDYLMEALEHKLYHFAHGTGLGAKYDAGELEAEDCLGRAGKAKIKIGKATEAYAAKNEVQDYVVEATQPADDPGDEIPGVTNPKTHAADEEDMPDFLKK